jgi:hypothetical protein
MAMFWFCERNKWLFSTLEFGSANRYCNKDEIKKEPELGSFFINDAA